MVGLQRFIVADNPPKEVGEAEAEKEIVASWYLFLFDPCARPLLSVVVVGAPEERCAERM